MRQAPSAVAEEFGEIDIYLFDQLLRGRIRPEMTVLDAGCGSGRNLVYLLRSGYEVMGVDEAPAAIDAVRQWEYTPTLLNNVPTAVIMTVTVTFTLN